MGWRIYTRAKGANCKVLEPKGRIIMFEKLMRFVLPTLQSTALQTDFDRLTGEQLDRLIEELKQAAALL